MSVRGYVDPNFPSPGGPNDSDIIIFGYRPSLVFPIIAIVTFAILALVHTYQAARYRTKFFSMVILASIFEIVGYIFRIEAHGNPYDVRWFVVSYFMLVVSPVLYSAAIYACLSSLVRGRWILATFVTLDVLTTVMQIAGAAGIGASESHRKDPTSFNNILIAGLAIQTFSILAFIGVLSVYIHSVRRGRHSSSSSHSILEEDGPRRTGPFAFGQKDKVASTGQLLALLGATLLVFARTVFRLGEAADGVLGPASSNEILFAMLDYFPIIIAVALLSIGHPGRYRSTDSVVMQQNGATITEK